LHVLRHRQSRRSDSLSLKHKTPANPVIAGLAGVGLHHSAVQFSVLDAQLAQLSASELLPARLRLSTTKVLLPDNEEVP
jgi:hypothetical protein